MPFPNEDALRKGRGQVAGEANSTMQCTLQTVTPVVQWFEDCAVLARGRGWGILHNDDNATMSHRLLNSRSLEVRKSAWANQYKTAPEKAACEEKPNDLNLACFV